MGQGLLSATRRLAAASSLLAVGCSHGLFSGVDVPDRSRPVARIETRGGVEYGATTAAGVLFLGRTATEGPCRVHYFLGEVATPLVEDGRIRHVGGVYYAAEIDLKTQAVPLLEREATADDALLAIVHAGTGTRELPVRLARGEGLEGDVLEWPGEPLPAGTGVFARGDDGLRFAGLVAGEAVVDANGASDRYLVFTGTDRLREALATPRPHPRATRVLHRPDDISVVK